MGLPSLERRRRVKKRTFSNFDSITEKATLTPLQTEGDSFRESDHRVFYAVAKLRRKERYKWLSYSYRYNNEDSAKAFGDWLLRKDWAGLVQTNGSNQKAEIYQDEINKAIEEFFPLKTTKRKNTDPPWINA